MVVLIGSADGDTGEEKGRQQPKQHGDLPESGVGLMRFAKQFFRDQVDDHRAGGGVLDQAADAARQLRRNRLTVSAL